MWPIWHVDAALSAIVSQREGSGSEAPYWPLSFLCQIPMFSWYACVRWMLLPLPLNKALGCRRGVGPLIPYRGGKFRWLYSLAGVLCLSFWELNRSIQSAAECIQYLITCYKGSRHYHTYHHSTVSFLFPVHAGSCLCVLSQKRSLWGCVVQKRRSLRASPASMPAWNLRLGQGTMTSSGSSKSEYSRNRRRLCGWSKTSCRHT